MVLIVGRQLLAKNVMINMAIIMNHILTIFMMVIFVMEMTVLGILILVNARLKVSISVLFELLSITISTTYHISYDSNRSVPDLGR